MRFILAAAILTLATPPALAHVATPGTAESIGHGDRGGHGRGGHDHGDRGKPGDRGDRDVGTPSTPSAPAASPATDGRDGPDTRGLRRDDACQWEFWRRRTWACKP